MARSSVSSERSFWSDSELLRMLRNFTRTNPRRLPGVTWCSSRTRIRSSPILISMPFFIRVAGIELMVTPNLRIVYHRGYACESVARYTGLAGAARAARRTALRQLDAGYRRLRNGRPLRRRRGAARADARTDRAGHG